MTQRLAIVIALLLLAGVTYWAWQRDDDSPADTASLSVGDLLSGGDSAGYARALAPRPFSFPADFGPHNDFRQEWWYYTGNLDTADGRHFGYQLTFFRFALAPSQPQRDSAWATRQVYLAHFALTDVQANAYFNDERIDRAALGLAGAQASPYQVWLEDWNAQGESPQGLPMHLHAASSRVAIDLRLESLKPAVLQGDRGLSQKGSQPGNASYYYSMTRMATAGTVRIDGVSYTVTGLSWMDREWSTSALERGQIGWDWFALQLADHRELMYYRLRRHDGSIDPHSRGIIVDADGAVHPLPPGAVTIDTTAQWRSPRSGALYPSGWRLTAPAYGIALQVTPYVADQELDHRLRYWEGAVRVSAGRGGQAIGSGYVELVGYAR